MDFEQEAATWTMENQPDVRFTTDSGLEIGGVPSDRLVPLLRRAYREGQRNMRDRAKSVASQAMVNAIGALSIEEPDDE